MPWFVDCGPSKTHAQKGKESTLPAHHTHHTPPLFGVFSLVGLGFSIFPLPVS